MSTRPPTDVDNIMDAGRTATSCSAHCSAAATRLNEVHTTKYPAAKIAVVHSAAPPRDASDFATTNSTGTADGLIIPAIITAHIAKAAATSVADHRVSVGMSMPAIAAAFIVMSCICAARW